MLSGCMSFSSQQESGLLRLAIGSILAGKHGDLLVSLAVCCSSWVRINAGTSLRDALVPEGFEEHRSVASSNLMVSRTGCCFALCS